MLLCPPCALCCVSSPPQGEEKGKGCSCLLSRVCAAPGAGAGLPGATETAAITRISPSPTLAPRAQVTLTGLRHWQTQNFLFPFISEFIHYSGCCCHCYNPSCSQCQAFRYLLGKLTATIILIRNVVFAATAVRKIRQRAQTQRLAPTEPSAQGFSPSPQSPEGNPLWNTNHNRKEMLKGLGL